MSGIIANKNKLNSYEEYISYLRWLLIIRDSIVDDRLIQNLRHHAFKTYFRNSEEIETLLGVLSVKQIITIALWELHYIVQLSDHGTLSSYMVLDTWLELNGKFFLQAFAPLCPQKNLTVAGLHRAMEKKLAP